MIPSLSNRYAHSNRSSSPKPNRHAPGHPTIPLALDFLGPARHLPADRTTQHPPEPTRTNIAVTNPTNLLLSDTVRGRRHDATVLAAHHIVSAVDATHPKWTIDRREGNARQRLPDQAEASEGARRGVVVAGRGSERGGAGFRDPWLRKDGQAAQGQACSAGWHCCERGEGGYCDAGCGRLRRSWKRRKSQSQHGLEMPKQMVLLLEVRAKQAT